MEDYDSNAGSQDEEEAYEERCPNDCDPDLWAHILELREMKLDQDDKVAEIQKLVDVCVSPAFLMTYLIGTQKRK